MKTTLIIGASTGIGRAIACELNSQGYRIGVASRRSDLLEELKAKLGSDHCVAKHMDVSKPSTAIKAFEDICNEIGTVDFIYVVAGIGFHNPTLEVDLEVNTIQVNCVGFSAIVSAAIRLFVKQGHGHLIGVTSLASVRPSAGAPAYGASKTFASTYLEAMRYLIAQKKLPIFITEARPGFVDTAMMKADRPFWVIDAQSAAQGIIRAASEKRSIAYIPFRWMWIALILRILPSPIYSKFM